MRNDYRRALILLRSSAPGYSGHVRLERRTLMGSMYFLVQAPCGCEGLRAALVGCGRCGYYACALGEMQRDSRGQAVLGYSFDPRNICGRELEQYQLIVVSDIPGNQVVLYGNVQGHAQLNWEQVRAALQTLYNGAEDLEPNAAPVGGLSEPDLTVQTQASQRQDAHSAVPGENTNLTEREDVQLEAGQQSAGEVLGLDTTLPWPQSIESMRTLFQEKMPMENPPDEEFTYIAAPMPEESGFAFCAVGLRVENGVPVSVRYALPASWSDEPPAGLEEYSWVGDQNQGWWVTEVPVERIQ